MTGAASLAALLGVFQRIAAAARERGARCVLVDLACMSGDLPDLDRYDLGKQGAEIFGRIERIAVVRSAHLRYTGFALDVAQNRGLDVRQFLDPVEAREWLTTP